MQEEQPEQLDDFLRRLNAGHIHYEVQKGASQTILVSISVPGEHWEAQFGPEGLMSFERFVSTGVGREERLKELYARFPSIGGQTR